VKKKYKDLLKNSDFHADKEQEKIVNLLHDLKENLESENSKRKKFFSRFFYAYKIDLQGYFIWGGFGRGKTVLMNLFFKSVNIRQKQRYHFHDFMNYIHEEIFKHRKKKSAEDYIESVAKKILKKGWVICLDEYEVRDVADAMILTRVFKFLITNGAVFIMTSNMQPIDHYKGGLQRQSYDNFCNFLLENINIYSLGGNKDYRDNKGFGKYNYLYPIDFNCNKTIHDKFADLAGCQKLQTKILTIKNRKLEIKHCNGNTALFDFFELCEQPLGVYDYQEITKHFKHILIQNIPKMHKEDRNEAKRFTTMIDVFYENKIKLYITAEVEMAKLYTAGQGSFEFNRTVSRLKELCV